MTVNARFLWAGALGIGLSAPILAQEPAPFAAQRAPTAALRAAVTNQQMADAIAEQLRQSGQLRDYHVRISFQNGSAELIGTVTDQPQRDEVLRLVQGVPGVERVRDRLQLVGVPAQEAIAQVQAVAPPAKPELVAPPDLGPGPNKPGAMPAGPTEFGPAPKKAAETPGASTEPFPIFQAPPPGPYDVNQPKMPPYAWPSYAPYNNYSRVAYPQLYPYNSWPFIGPCYPFPKIPLGWRSVKLEWQDGYWWYSRHSNSHDWWRLRYW